MKRMRMVEREDLHNKIIEVLAEPQFIHWVLKPRENMTAIEVCGLRDLAADFYNGKMDSLDADQVKFRSLIDIQAGLIMRLIDEQGE
jgi:hypothetical protein